MIITLRCNDASLGYDKRGRIEAKIKGVKFDRDANIDSNNVQILREQGLGATTIACQMKIGRPTAYKALTTLGREVV